MTVDVLCDGHRVYRAPTRSLLLQHTHTHGHTRVHAEAGRNDKDLCTMTGGHVDRQGDKPSRQDCEAERVTNCMVHFHIANLWADTSGRNSHVQSEPSRQKLTGKCFVYSCSDSVFTCGEVGDVCRVKRRLQHTRQNIPQIHLIYFTCPSRHDQTSLLSIAFKANQSDFFTVN